MRARLSCLTGCFLLCIAALASAQDTQPTPPPSRALLDLNRAIRAYQQENRDEAARLFAEVRTAAPGAEITVACDYYLGLIELERGLGHASAAQAARAQGERDEAVRQAAEARQRFETARQYFDEVIRSADPSAELVSAALLLGISQLASDDSGARGAIVSLAEQAESTLARYVATEYGAADRYGWFYLAVARYRLSDSFRERADKQAEYDAAVQGAEAALAQAEKLSSDDLALGRLTPQAYETFQTVLAYYRGLVAIMRRDYAGARTLFENVFARAGETELGRNAEVIIKRLKEVGSGGAQGLQLPVPGPIGPLDFQARIRVGNGYDTNVILLGKETELPRGFKRQDDYFLNLQGEFNLSRTISKTEAPWLFGETLTLGLGGGAAAAWQPNISQFDVNRYPARTYINWEPLRDLFLGFEYEYSYTQLGHKPYISSNRVTPVISKLWRGGGGEGNLLELGRTDLYYTHDDRAYFDEVSDPRLNRTGTYQAVGIIQTFNLVQSKDLPYMQDYFNSRERERALFGPDWLSFYLGYEYRDERTVGTEFDLRGNCMTFGFNVPLPYRLAFQMRSEFSWAGYTGPSVFSFHRDERSDFLQRYDFGLIYWFVKRGEDANLPSLDVRLRTGVEMTFQNSNIWDRLGQDVYEYNRTIYGVQLEVDF